MVFQDYALFPHLTVAENVAFGVPREGRVRRVARPRRSSASASRAAIRTSSQAVSSSAPRSPGPRARAGGCPPRRALVEHRPAAQGLDARRAHAADPARGRRDRAPRHPRAGGVLGRRPDRLVAGGKNRAGRRARGDSIPACEPLGGGVRRHRERAARSGRPRPCRNRGFLRGARDERAPGETVDVLVRPELLELTRTRPARERSSIGSSADTMSSTRWRLEDGTRVPSSDPRTSTCRWASVSP